LRLVKFLCLQRRDLPSAVSVTLKITACVCNCGAAYPSTGRLLSCSNFATAMRPSSALRRCRRCAPAHTFPSRPEPRERSPMGFSHAAIAADKRRQRDGFRSGKRRVPPARAPSRAPFRLCRSRIRAPAGGVSEPRRFVDAGLGEPCELLFIDLAAQPVTLGKLALPLAPHTLAFRVIVLLRIGELRLVVRLRLACRDSASTVSASLYNSSPRSFRRRFRQLRLRRAVCIRSSRVELFASTPAHAASCSRPPTRSARG